MSILRAWADRASRAAFGGAMGGMLVAIADAAYATDGNNINGSSENADQVRSEMRVSIVQQLLSSIQMLKPAELEALQKTAEAKAKMEADALEAERQAEAAELAEQPESIQLPIAIPGQ